MTAPSELRAVRAATALTADGPRSSMEIEVTDGRISAIVAASGPVPDVVVAPGFVDLQVNGVDDVDCASAGGDDWVRAGAHLAATGVTGWLPTLVSQPLAGYAEPLASIAAAMATDRPAASVLGAHLEGPFLGGRPGAHRPEHLVPIDLPWLEALPGVVRLVTLAPEQADSVAATGLLAGRGVVVSLGHSHADHVTVARAVDAGARMVTHLFNGMGPLHHREPGIVGAALADDRLAVGLIADGVHVHPSLFRTVFRAKGADRVVLVTDAVAWRAGSLTGSRGEARARVVDGAPRLEDGTLAGSVLTMDAAVRNVVDAGVDLADAVRAASATPASVLGEPDRGRIAVGCRADLVVLGSDDLGVRRTIVGGRTAWES